MISHSSSHGAAPTGAVFVSTYAILAAGLAFIERREDKKLTAYQDERGIWTIGVGHTAAAGAPYPVHGMKISDADADAIFRRDLRQYVGAVNSHLTRACSQPQGDAMVSLCYNIGVHGFAGSEVVRYFNAGNLPAAADAFRNWHKPESLKERREIERHLFLTGEYR